VTRGNLGEFLTRRRPPLTKKSAEKLRKKEKKGVEVKGKKDGEGQWG